MGVLGFKQAQFAVCDRIGDEIAPLQETLGADVVTVPFAVIVLGSRHEARRHDHAEAAVAAPVGQRSSDIAEHVRDRLQRVRPFFGRDGGVIDRIHGGDIARGIVR